MQFSFSIAVGILETCLTFELFYNFLQFIFMGIENPTPKTQDEKKIWGDDPAPIKYEEVSPYEDGEEIELSADYGGNHREQNPNPPNTPGPTES